MNTFTIHLKNLTPSDASYWGEGTRYMIGLKMQEYFRQVINYGKQQTSQQQTGFTEADVSWSSTPGSVKPGEVVIYFVPSERESLIRMLAPQEFRPGKNDGITFTSGNTMSNHAQGAISEVYVSIAIQIASLTGVNLASRLAATDFHESMHNKLSPMDIHSAAGGGLAATDRDAFVTQLSVLNKQIMAENLSKEVIQNTLFLQVPANFDA